MSLSISILQFHFQYSNFCLQYFKNLRFTLSFQKLRILRISSILTFRLSKRNLYKHTHTTTDPSTYHIPSLNNTGKHLRNIYFADPYVKVYLLCQDRRIKKKKTSVKKNTLFPVYNEILVFDVPAENIEDVSLIVKVIDYDRYVGDKTEG